MLNRGKVNIKALYPLRTGNCMASSAHLAVMLRMESRNIWAFNRYPHIRLQGYKIIGIGPCHVDTGFLQTAAYFKLSADIQRMDGIFENICFDNRMPNEIDLDGDWIFEVSGQPELLRKLSTL